MDSNEVSRQTAERLHLVAVANGNDPCEPYVFACAEATRRNLAVEKVPKEDVRLHGARALFDPDALLIIHEDTGDEFSNAFLVGHEIGHVEFGGQEEFASTGGADPLRSSEVAPVGVDRVVDYSSKERREVQMDLFAREFLLPRAWMRRLHVDDKSTANDIAAKCKAPFAVVAQQLLDALLLPSVLPALPKSVAVKPLNADQIKAVKHRGKPYLLEAGPGTGKTQTLVARVTDLLASGGNPGRILVLTFSNKAAGELSERITLHNPEAAEGMWIGTFHAFGLDLIRRFHDRLGLPIEPRLIDRTDALELLENEYPRLELIHFKNLWDPSQPLNLVLNAISRSNDEVVGAARYRDLAESMLKIPEHRAVGTDDQEIAAVVESIEELRAAGHSYRDQAVLCSGNARLGRFAQGLERLGVPVLYLGSLFERSEIKDLLCLLSILVDRRAMGLVRTATMPEYSISLADVACILSHLKKHETEPLQWASDLKAIEGLTAEGIEGLTRVSELLNGFGVTADPWTVLATFLLNRSRLADKIASETDISARSRGVAIWQFMNFLRNQPPGSGLPIVRVLERIRRLVLHADERDLRQLPAAALGMDAVRLMTMHGSKGLEFEVVHIPGMTAASLPRSPNSLLAQTIIPPDGLIEGAAESGAGASRDAMIEEQECLFFVALSRARDRLFLYYPTTNANGSSRPGSSFISRLGNTVRGRQIVPSVELPPGEGGFVIPISIEGTFAFTDHRLALYERCPRRFFYTHILDIGGRRTESAFMKLHAAVQQVVTGISQDADSAQSLADMEEHLAVAWETHGPDDHGYSDDYKRIASQLIRFFFDTTSAMKRLPTPELRLPIAGGEIIITPDQVLSDAAGRVHMRRVRTGHKRSKDEENLAAAAFHIAATAHSPGCTVQLVYLSDGEITPVKMTDRVLGNRADSISKMLVAVKAGQFPLKQSITCPRCPAFFICGNVPAGSLVKKLPE